MGLEYFYFTVDTNKYTRTRKEWSVALQDEGLFSGGRKERIFLGSTARSEVYFLYDDIRSDEMSCKPAIGNWVYSALYSRVVYLPSTGENTSTCVFVSAYKDEEALK